MTFYVASWYRGEPPAEHLASVEFAFARIAAHEGVTFGPIRREPEEEARMMETRKPDAWGDTCRVYAADPVTAA